MQINTNKHVVLFLIFTCMASLAAGQKQLKFKKAILSKGATLTMARDSHSTAKQVFEMGETVQERSEDKKSKRITIFEVLAANEKGIVRAKVTFKTMKETKKSMTSLGDSNENKDFPLVGKTFTLDCSKGSLVAKNSSNEDATKEELAAIEKEFGENLKSGVLFSPYFEMDRIVGAREMAVGENVKVDQEAVRRLLGVNDSSNNFGSMTLTLVKKKRVLGVPCAIFDLKLEIDSSEIEAKGLKVESDISGQLVLALDMLWVQSVGVKGPVTAAGDLKTGHGSAKVSLEGSANISSMIVVQQPRKK